MKVELAVVIEKTAHPSLADPVVPVGEKDRTPDLRQLKWYDSADQCIGRRDIHHAQVEP